jgi:hypothetical protein
VDHSALRAEASDCPTPFVNDYDVWTYAGLRADTCTLLFVLTVLAFMGLLICFIHSWLDSAGVYCSLEGAQCNQNVNHNLNLTEFLFLHRASLAVQNERLASNRYVYLRPLPKQQPSIP